MKIKRKPVQSSPLPRFKQQGRQSIKTLSREQAHVVDFFCPHLLDYRFIQGYLSNYLSCTCQILMGTSRLQSLRPCIFRWPCAQPSRPSGQGGHQRIQEDFDTLGMFANVTGSLLHVEISDRINLNYWK